MSLSAIRQYDEDWNLDNFSTALSSMLSAIRQYDEDWNGWRRIASVLLAIFQPFASMMRIETCYKRCLSELWSLSAIRQYDEDWNL